MRPCSGNVHVFSVLLAVVLCLESPASAQLGASEDQMQRMLGKPCKKSGDLIHYLKPPYHAVVHMFHGECDQICIFSATESGGFPNALGDGDIDEILRVYGAGMTWVPVGRLSMNRVWNSGDGKSFAIYETMYNKLVLMTRASYRRENQKKKIKMSTE